MTHGASIVVYCPRCDYFLKVAIYGPVGTHGCTQCDGQMEVYVPQELAVRDFEHTPVNAKEDADEHD